MAEAVENLRRKLTVHAKTDPSLIGGIIVDVPKNITDADIEMLRKLCVHRVRFNKVEPELF
jgi:F0F1-type ATP synthase delta subunit